MQFVRPYTYLFSRPEWAKNLLTQSLPLFVGSLLPFTVLGTWPVLGYFAMRVKRTAGEIDEEHIPSFRTDRLSDYFSRGGWPFLYAAIPFGIWLIC